MFSFLITGIVGRGKETWTRVSTTWLTILTEDSPKRAKEWAVCLEALRADLKSISPMDDRKLDPMTIVIFRNAKSYRAVVTPNEPRGDRQISLSKFRSLDGRCVGGVNPEDSEMARSAIFFQGCVWLTASYRVPLPTWLSYGLQNLYSYYSLSGDKIEIGDWLSGYASDLKGGLNYSLEQMFAVSPYLLTNETTVRRFNGQCWAFVHYLRFGDRGAHQAELMAYLKAIQRGEDPAASLALLAPKGMADLTARFTDYTRRSIYRSQPIPVSYAAIAATVVVAPATEAEVQVALGYLTLFVHGPGNAAPYFERATALDPNSPVTLEGLAELASAKGDERERDLRYAEAVQHGSTFYIAHYATVYPAVAAMFGNEAAADQIDAGEARKAFDAMKRLLRLRPGFQLGHTNLAGMAGALSETSRDDEVLLQEGVQLFPDDALMESGMVAYEVSQRQFKAARARIERIRNTAMANKRAAAPYLNKLIDRCESSEAFARLEASTLQHDYTSAAKILEDMERPRLLPAEHLRFEEISLTVRAKGVLDRVRNEMDVGHWEAADRQLQQIESLALPDEVKAEIVRQRAVISARRAGKPVSVRLHMMAHAA
jgi:hypothetical protein